MKDKSGIGKILGEKRWNTNTNERHSEHADLSSDDESMTSDEEYERDPDRSKYRFSESVIQQRMEEDRERVSAVHRKSDLIANTE